jgi:hypothetical protein
VYGPFRQWTNGNLRALVEPTPTGSRLRLETSKGDARQLMTGGMLVAGGAAATSIALALNGALSSNTGAPGGITLMAFVGVAMFAIGALRVPGWARLRQSQIDQIIARLTSSSGDSQSTRLNSGQMPDLR